ncbi:MAG: type I restriction endonuclease subunit R [Cyanothece sp. SIO2G6]|nr:type I restriction endonuclease subunit R [Cyanothece sp. SIO2G6]
MTTILQAKTLSLYDLEQKFHLTPATSVPQPSIWGTVMPDLAASDLSALVHIADNYNNQARYLPLSEELVKMVVLSPLLDLAGFYSRHFRLSTEESVEIALQEEDELIKGRIDVLIVQDQFWVLAIESKRVQLDVMAALPQLLVYLLNSPAQQPEPLGLLTNGREFVFTQILPTAVDAPQYTCSDAFAINRSTDFQTVLKTLRAIASTKSVTPGIG